MDEALAYTHLMGVSQGRMADVMGRMFGEGFSGACPRRHPTG